MRQPKFEIGDFVIGNDKSSCYAYTTKETVWRVIDNDYSTHYYSEKPIILLKQYDGDDEYLLSISTKGHEKCDFDVLEEAFDLFPCSNDRLLHVLCDKQ